MQVPLILQFRDMRSDPAIESLIRRKAERLDRVCDNLTSCRVLVAEPHAHPDNVSSYQVRIELRTPPGHTVVVHKKPGDLDPNDPLEAVVNTAFEAAERQLKEIVERRRDEVRATPEEPWGLVVKLEPDRDFGFLKTPSGRDVYFHRNAVLGDDFERLELGTSVRFEEVMGRDGPQATTVQILDKPGARAGDGPAPEAAEPPEGWSPS